MSMGSFGCSLLVAERRRGIVSHGAVVGCGWEEWDGWRGGVEGRRGQALGEGIVIVGGVVECRW